MSQPSDAAWSRVREAARTASDAARGLHTTVASGPGSHDVAVRWRGECGWQCALPAEDPRRPLLALSLPFCSATKDRPMTLGHLGQSLDGFIATHTGESQWV